MSKIEKYELEIGDEGLDYDILDVSFNPTTQAFISDAGIKPGMKVLDVGCGAGVMTAWLAKCVGPTGTVTAIDNSEVQLNVTRKRLEKENLSNVKTQVLSAYDIHQLNEKFDFIYCRFVLHHLHSPRSTIKIFYDNLKPNGIYVGEEGRVSAAFAYPASFAWNGYIPELKKPALEKDGENRDGDFGMKLFYYAKQAGFDIVNCNLVQPLLWKKEQKKGLLNGLKAYKKTDLEHGISEDEWQKKYDETVRLINDDTQMIGFYGSCQVAGVKNNK
jgi:SAM-dependent methyltransferase